MQLRAALHVHSTWSYDGTWGLEQLADAFARRGYGALLITEHDLGLSEEKRRAHREACRKVSTDHLLVIPGVEYSDAANAVHILTWGDIPFLGAGQETHLVLERAGALGGVCVFAHPSRREAWRLFRTEWLEHLSAIEVWNRKTDGWSPSPDALRLARETRSASVVGLDFHSQKQFFPLAVCMECQERVDEKQVLGALRSGSYSCEAFGLGLEQFTAGMGNATASLLESGRRSAARAARSLGIVN